MIALMVGTSVGGYVGYWIRFWERGYYDHPKNFREWAECVDLYSDWNTPIRLKFQNPNTLPRRWQTPNR